MRLEIEPNGQRDGSAVASRRIAMWDRLRILAFLDIVSVHVTGEHALLGVGLPLFLILRFALGARHPQPLPLRDFLWQQFRRLLLPWVAWSLLLGLLVAVQGMKHGKSLGELFQPNMLLYGTVRYLWFLPFAVVGGCATYLLDRATQRLRTEWLVAGCVVLAAALLAIPRFSLPYPFDKWLFAVPSIPLGLAAGRGLARPQVNRRWLWSGLLASALVATAYLYRDWRPGELPLMVPPMRYCLALILLGVGALLPNVSDRWTSRLPPLLLGGYLLHDVIYYQVLYRVAQHFGLQPGPLLAIGSASCAVLVVVALLRRTPMRAIL